MHKFAIIPHIGVNELKFGIRRSEAHRLLGLPVGSKRNRHSHQLVDYWNDHSLQLAFSQDAEELEEILMFDRLEDVELSGIHFFKQSRRDVMDALVAMDRSVVEEVPVADIQVNGNLPLVPFHSAAKLRIMAADAVEHMENSDRGLGK